MLPTSRQYTVQFSDRHLIIIGKALGVVLLVFLTAAAIYVMRNLITPVVISIFLAYLIKPLIDMLEYRGVSRGWGILIVFVGFLVLVYLGVSTMREKVTAELETLLGSIHMVDPEIIIEQMRDRLKAAFPRLSQSRIIDLAATGLVNSYRQLLGASQASFETIFSAIGAAIIVPFLTFFLLKDSRALNRAIIGIFPNRYFEMSLSLLYKANRQLGRYIRGVLLDAAIVGTLVMIALSLVELRYAVFIGALAGLANLIPYLGPVVGGIPAIAISIVDRGDLSGVPTILLAFAIVKAIDDAFIQPVVVSKSVELHPVIVIIGIYVGGHLGGILGMVIAVPIIAIIKVSLGILHWGFTKYHIFAPPEFAFATATPSQVPVTPPPATTPTAPAPPTNDSPHDGEMSSVSTPASTTEPTVPKPEAVESGL